MSMNLEQANHCVQLAQFLETLKPEKWDYCHVRETSYDEGEVKITDQGFCVKATCHTTACACGWCPEVFPNKFKIEIGHIDKEDVLYGGQVDISVMFKSGNGWREVGTSQLSKWFGLTERQVDNVFWGDDTYSFYNKDCMEEVTAKDVARKLYELVQEAGYDVVSK